VLPDGSIAPGSLAPTLEALQSESEPTT
jgi:hypothetical protein